MKEAIPLGWAGIDIGKGHHWVCLIDQAGTTVWSAKVVNDEAAILDAIGAPPEGTLTNCLNLRTAVASRRRHRAHGRCRGADLPGRPHARPRTGRAAGLRR